jgi:acetate---CoA ligase (ADP-forming)
MRRNDVSPPPPGDKSVAGGHPPLKGEGGTAEGSPGWGGGGAVNDSGAVYAETPSPPPGPLTRADLPPADTPTLPSPAGGGGKGGGGSATQQSDRSRQQPASVGGGEERLRQALFSPRSVAVVGQSNDPGKTAGRPLKFLRQAGFAGRIYPVNARRREVLGERAWPSIDALPEVPEHAYVVTPPEGVMEAIEACGRAGVAVATVLTDGFAEVGAAGRAREARLREIVATTGMRIVGPSSLGIVNLRNGMLLTANATFDEPDLPTGRIFAASHSGGMIGTLLSRGKACGIGFAGLVSVGNEVDLSLGEICDAVHGDPDIDGYLLFLETLRHADKLRAFAQRAAALGKPILAYKLGRSEQGRELAVTHTGALAGEDDVADAFFRDCGIARVETLSALIEGLPLLARVPARRETRKPRAAVVTTTAGGAAMVIDPLASREVDVTAPSEATCARFGAAGIKVSRSRLIDLTLAGARYEVMKAALDILTMAPEFDVVVVVVGSSARFYPELAVQPIIDSAGSDKPMAVFLVPEAPQARAALGKAGVANFYTPEACADAVAAVLARREPRLTPPPTEVGPARLRSLNIVAEPPPPFPPPLAREGGSAGGRSAAERPGGGDSASAFSATPPHPTPGRLRRQESALCPPPPGEGGSTLDELEAYALLDWLGIPRAPSVALDVNITHAPALPFGYPVALKALSSAITHKSDVGGVTLGIANATALAAAIAAMRARLPQVRHVLVQPMIAGIGEALIGYRVDPDVGPLVLVAVGGIYTEIYRDRSLRLAPVDADTAFEMIAEVRGLKVLTGYRGKPAGDIAALAQAIAALSRLAADSAVAEAEINPLIVSPHGVVAVDAVVRMREIAGGASA